MLLRAQRIVLELLAGLDLSYGDIPRGLQRLYAFVLESISAGSVKRVTGAIEVLSTLRDALREIRPEAVSFERSGTIPSADLGRSVQAIG